MGIATPPRRVLVVLIHGTWARRAPWTLPRSWFRRELAAALERRGLAPPEMANVDWSGSNTHSARADGSRRLSALLRELEVGPEDACFLVGHSHGGNVALHAVVHDDVVRDTVHGVVTLATPFLLLRAERPLVAQMATLLDRSALAALVWAASILIPWSLALPFNLLLNLLLPRVVEWKIAWINLGRNDFVSGCSWLWTSSSCRWAINGSFGLISAGFLVVITLAILYDGYNRAKDEQAAQRREAAANMARFAYLQPSERLSRTPILALSAPVDEALQVLNASWWAHRLRLWVLRLAVVASLAGGAIATWIALYQISMYEQSLVGTPDLTFSNMVSVAVAKVAFVPLAFGAGALIGSVIRLAASLPALGLGSPEGRDNLHWTVHASRHPIGAPLATKRSYALLDLLRRGGPLIHSRLYRSERALEDIADFVARSSALARGSVPVEATGPVTASEGAAPLP